MLRFTGAHTSIPSSPHPMTTAPRSVTCRACRYPGRTTGATVDFIAVSPSGTLYLTWDYGRSLKTRYGNIVSGWLTRPIRVSRRFGNANVWPGDTIGLSLLPASGHGPRKIQVSWGSAVTAARISHIFTATVTP